MPRFYPITIEIEGHNYSGTWRLKQGCLITVAGFYGSRTVELGSNRKPEDVAAKVLRELVKAWQAKNERERKAWEAKRKRLNPGPPRC